MQSIESFGYCLLIVVFANVAVIPVISVNAAFIKPAQMEQVLKELEKYTQQ